MVELTGIEPVSKTHTLINSFYAIVNFVRGIDSHNIILIRGITNGDVKIYTHSTTYFLRK